MPGYYPIHDVSCTYKGLCDIPLNLLINKQQKYVQNHKGAVTSFPSGKLIVTNYVAYTSDFASPGFRVSVKTVPGQTYRLQVTAGLKTGDEAFLYVEDCPSGTRLVNRSSYNWLSGAGKTSYDVQFEAIGTRIFVGILFQCPNVTYCLDTCEFILSCPEAVDCDPIIQCICDIPACPDQFTYRICTDVTQTALDWINMNFLAGTNIFIVGYRLDEGTVVGATGIPETIGTTPVIFQNLQDAFVAQGWSTIPLSGDSFQAVWEAQPELISHVAIDSILAVGPPFTINLPTNCTQIDSCLAENPENRTLLKKPDNSLCWAQVCPPVIETCTVKCGDEDHIGILPAASFSANASLSVGPRGSGFLCAQKPTPGSVVGGNCRGEYAIDWQMLRDNPDAVAGADLSIIGGGESNKIISSSISDSKYASIFSGKNNIALGRYSHIGSGSDNLIQSTVINSTTDYSAIGSGFNNKITTDNGFDASCAFITSGERNEINTDKGANSNFSIITGGERNTIESGTHNIIAGGQGNTIETGTHSIILSGFSNTCNGSNSIVGGNGSSVNFNNSFVFGINAGIGNTADNQVVLLPVPNTPIANGLNVVTNGDGLIGIGDFPAQRGCPVFVLNYGPISDIAANQVAPELNWADITIGTPTALNDPMVGLTKAVQNNPDYPGYVPMKNDLVLVVVRIDPLVPPLMPILQDRAAYTSATFRYDGINWIRKEITIRIEA